MTRQSTSHGMRACSRANARGNGPAQSTPGHGIRELASTHSGSKSPSCFAPNGFCRGRIDPIRRAGSFRSFRLRVLASRALFRVVVVRRQEADLDHDQGSYRRQGTGRSNRSGESRARGAGTLHRAEGSGSKAGPGCGHHTQVCWEQGNMQTHIDADAKEGGGFSLRE